MNRLKTKLGKLEMKNPVTVASGTFSLDFQDFFDVSKLGAFVTKTITKNYKPGNKPPRIFETSGGMLNSIGLQNPGLEGFISETLPQFKEVNTPLIVSFSGSTINEFAEILSRLEDCEGISGYEVNVSCPNVENEGIAFGTNAKTVFELTKKLAKITNRELIIKLSPNVTNIVEIAKATEDGGADSVALINTLLGMEIDFETGKSYFKRGVAGYSGPSIKPVALWQVYQVFNAVKIPILAMGGISNWQDALQFIYAGASAIAIGTANFVDPTVTIKTISQLDNFLKEKNKTLSEIRGTVWGIE